MMALRDINAATRRHVELVAVNTKKATVFSKEQLLDLVEGVLQEHVLDTLQGTFRWHRELVQTGGFCAAYRLRYVQSCSVWGFNFPFITSVCLLVDTQMSPTDALFLRWRIDGRKTAALCNAIVKETDTAIREAIAEAEDTDRMFEHKLYEYSNK